MKERIGTWKNGVVYAVFKEDYDNMKEKNDIYVIMDDGNKVIFEGNVVGMVTNGGHIIQTQARVYQPVVPVAAKKEKKKEKKEEEIVEDQFYKQYSKTVDEFFMRTYDPIIMGD